MGENQSKIDELEEKINSWQNELDTYWKDKNTDAAEMERRNLNNLIQNAKREIKELKGENVKEELPDSEKIFNDLKKLKDKIKNFKKEDGYGNIENFKLLDDKDMKRLNLSLERLKEEREMYESQKNGSYKKIYEEITKRIEEIEEQFEIMEEYEEIQKNKDIYVRALTKGRMEVEKEIQDIKEQMRLERINFNESISNKGNLREETTDDNRPREEKISWEDLKRKLEEKEALRAEYQELIDDVKGYKEKTTEYTDQQYSEYTKFFHGQGDIVENGRDDRRANDEFFGFEGEGKGSTGENLSPTPPKPTPKPDPTPPKPTPKPDPTPKPEPTPPEPTPPEPTPPEPPEPTPPEPPEPIPPEPDPTPKPEEKEDDDKLPVKSGLQVYRQVLNEIGYIKGTKAINAHDWLEKFGLIGKLAAAGIRVATGRKKEIRRIEDILDDLSEEDLNLMMDDYITKNNNTRTIIGHKHNDIFLRALSNKLERERTAKDPELKEEEQKLDDYITGIENELETATTQQEKSQLMGYLAIVGNAKYKIHRKREALGDRIDTVKRGRDEKSLDKKDNIQGKTRANRNPDNREEINTLADIELKKLEAEQRGDKGEAILAEEQMEAYEDSQTEYKYRFGKAKASVGKFEAPKGEVKKISERRYIVPELVHAVATALSITAAQACSLLNQQDTINRGIETVNNANSQRLSDLQGIATDKVVNTTQSSLDAEALNVQLTGERVSSFTGRFDASSSAYKAMDAKNVSISDGVIKDVNGFNPTASSNLGKISEIFRKKAEIAQGGGQQVADKLSKAASKYYKGSSHIISNGGVDHTVTKAIEESAAEINATQAETYGFVAKLCEKVSGISMDKFSKIKLDLKPLLLTLIPSASKTAQEVIENRRKKNKDPKTIEVDETEQEQITGEEPEI